MPYSAPRHLLRRQLQGCLALAACAGGHPLHRFSTIGLLLLALVGLPARAAPEPPQPLPAEDTSKLRVTLTRLGCGIGRCPQYSVQIEGSGRVVFDGGGDLPAGQRFPTSVYRRPPFFSPDVVVPGRQEDHVPPEAVAALAHRFEEAHFFDLADSYVAMVTDEPNYSLTLETDRGTKHVEDYAGTRVGMPAVVRTLEDEVDRVANTARWVDGAPGLIDWLAATGFDFTSVSAAAIALHGPDVPPTETLLGMIDRGLPLETVTKGRDGQSDSLLGLDLLRDAIQEGRAQIFQRLAAAGWLARLRAGEANHLFARWGAGCDPALAEAAVAAGIPVDAVTVAEPSRQSVGGQTALAALQTFRWKPRDARLATAKRLLALGANPNHCDRRGRTPLFEADDFDMVETLLANGADVTIRDESGLGPVFATWNDAIVVRLLQAGASPEGRDEDGHTLSERATLYAMPATARWLAAHSSK
ncbi:DUF6438 domain-containing protein [Nitrospirillum sp. BR 11164]|uniref:DUF6438 domain-containing protein n=1 Tax=Nitrospirillum sp. BR 11164 TaxID=3104324 RepID=UPI002AFFBA92|nr:DUF6438 domain-containing protein [Nitrospirillum sp. BR 11164]MEA1650713.1 DUF6438 domain-containing protein [Nitrospirillum sp. BR 11164]